MVGIGAGNKTYRAELFDDLAMFQQLLVNSKSRQLRFSAFGVVNNLEDQFPRVKIAIIKRAYWMKVPDPKNVWCNNPEAAWTAVAASFFIKGGGLVALRSSVS